MSKGVVAGKQGFVQQVSSILCGWSRGHEGSSSRRSWKDWLVLELEGSRAEFGF